MFVPTFYIVAEGNAYALDIDGIPFGAPVFNDGKIDWDNAYDFDPCDVEDIEDHRRTFTRDPNPLHVGRCGQRRRRRRQAHTRLCSVWRTHRCGGRVELR